MSYKRKLIFLILFLLNSPLAISDNTQPIVTPKEHLHRFTLALNSSAGIGIDYPPNKISDPDLSGFGLNFLGGSFGFSSMVLRGFEIGGSLKVGASSRSKLFDNAVSDAGLNGMRADLGFLMRYLHQLSQRFDLGLMFSYTYGGWWSNKAGQGRDVRKNIWDFTANFGPAASLIINDNISLYGTIAGSLKIPHKPSIVVNADKIQDSELYDIEFGINAPIGLIWQHTNMLGLYLELNTRIDNFNDTENSFKEEISIGLNITFQGSKER
jgi:hypothetical protein